MKYNDRLKKNLKKSVECPIKKEEEKKEEEEEEKDEGYYSHDCIFPSLE